MISRNDKTEKTPQPIRCAIYTRKSTNHGLEQAYSSLDAQRDSAEAYIRSQESLGWVCLPEIYDDGGYSGGNMDRPALNRLLSDIKAGLIDCVIVYKVDRLSRSLHDFGKIVELFDKYDVSFVSVTQHFNTTNSMGRLTLNILLSFAQFEREMISERTRDKMAATRKRGKWTGGRPVLGYDLLDTKLVINELESERIREIFTMYLERRSLLSVAKELNSRGWTTKRWTTKKNTIRGGGAFTKNNLHYLLRNPVYIGKVKFQEQMYEGEHDGIVDTEVFTEVQQLLLEQGKSGGRNGPRTNHGGILGGLLRCQSCQCSMTHSYTAKGRKRYRYYVCSKAQKRGYQVCPTPTVSAGEIERFVIEKIRALGRDPVILEGMLEEVSSQTKRERQSLKQEEVLIAKQVTSAYEELSQVSVRSGTEDRMADIQEQINRHQKRLSEVRRRLQQFKREQINPQTVQQRLFEFDALWRTLTMREQHELLQLTIEKIHFDGPVGEITIDYHSSGIQTLFECTSLQESEA